MVVKKDNAKESEYFKLIIKKFNIIHIKVLTKVYVSCQST